MFFILNHVAFIVDGNRRWARKNNLDIKKGHEEGAKVLGNVIKWSYHYGLKETTFYIFSTENFNRSEEEKNHLFLLFKDFFNKLNEKKDAINELLDKENVKPKIRFIGDKTLLPKDIVKIINILEEKTRLNNDFIINFCLAYGGRKELIYSFKKIASLILSKKISVEDIDEDLIRDNLWLSSEPDLIVRTGGNLRISNFLLWQSAYSEFFFAKFFWPEMSKKKLYDIFNDFNNRERRFGK